MKTKLIFLCSVIIAFAFLTALFLGSFLFVQKTSETKQISQNLKDVILTPVEVAKHNKLSDCWMTIDNKVYDITPYTNSHPGGNAELEKGCGIDATNLYGTKGGSGNDHSNTARSMLSKYYIGELNQVLTTNDLQTKITSIGNSTESKQIFDEDDDYEDD